MLLEVAGYSVGFQSEVESEVELLRKCKLSVNYCCLAKAYLSLWLLIFPLASLCRAKCQHDEMAVIVTQAMEDNWDFLFVWVYAQLEVVAVVGHLSGLASFLLAWAKDGVGLSNMSETS